MVWFCCCLCLRVLVFNLFVCCDCAVVWLVVRAGVQLRVWVVMCLCVFMRDLLCDVV